MKPTVGVGLLMKSTTMVAMDNYDGAERDGKTRKPVGEHGGPNKELEPPWCPETLHLWSSRAANISPSFIMV